MDFILRLVDDYVFDRAYAYLLPHPPIPVALTFDHHNSTHLPSAYSTSITSHPSLAATSLLPRDSMLRQTISLYTIALLGAAAIYFLFCSLSYFFIFDHRLKHHPRYIHNQVWLEIRSSLIAMPTIDALTIPWFLGEVRGHSMLYEDPAKYGYAYLVASIVWYLVFTDFCIYWVHRLEHHPRIYKHVHKPHHRWISKSHVRTLIVEKT